MNKQIINKINKAHIKSKKSKVSKVDTMKDLKPTLKEINKYFRLEKLKQQEKISQFQDGFIDPSKKHNFLFLRSESKSNNKVFTPSTNFCKKIKNFSTLYKKSLSLKGFRNHSGKKIETEVLTPRNYDDILLLIDLKDTKNDLMIKRYLIKKELNRKKKKAKNAISRNPEKNKIKLKTKNEGLTKSIILMNNTITNSNTPDNNNKTKRAFTSKRERNTPKSTIYKSINESKNNTYHNSNNNNNRNYRIIKSATTDRAHNSKIQKEYYDKINNNNLQCPKTISSYKNISCYTTNFGSYSRSCSKKAKNKKIFKTIEKKVLNKEFFLINKNLETPFPTEKSEFKSTKQLIRRIVNDCNIIDKYLKKKDKGSGEEHSFHKKKKDKILLKLSDRLKLNRLKRLQSIKKEKGAKVISEDEKDEKAFKEKLAKIPNIAKKFFRDVYKQMLFEKRILNKIDKKNIIESIEEKEEKKKFNEDIKKEVKQRMILTKENIITERDDKKLINEQKKLFDLYGTIDGLEWLIMKRHITNFGESRQFKRRKFHKNK